MDRMKIKKQVLKNFNAGLETTFNESYNIDHGIPTWQERSLLSRVCYDKYVLFNGVITQKDIEQYLGTLV